MSGSATKLQKVSRSDVIEFLERYGQNVSAGDLAGVAACWRVPALVLSDDQATPVAQTAEIERFFEEASGSYRAKGLVATKPELERLEELSERLISVDVRWPAFDASGAEKSSERSHYILHFDQAGNLGIRVALTLTGSVIA